MSEHKRDLVERLRQCLKANAGVSGVVLYSPVKDDDIREAADEIERLRAELAKLRKFGPVNQAVAAERAAILDLIETFEYRPSRSTTGAVLDDIVSAIKARDRHHEGSSSRARRGLAKPHRTSKPPDCAGPPWPRLIYRRRGSCGQLYPAHGASCIL
jgi:hypothetical protein